MENRSVVFRFILVCFFTVLIGGCDTDELFELDELDESVKFLSASPKAGSTIQPHTQLVFTFDGTPENVKINGEKESASGNTVVFSGPFTPGDLQLKITWDGDSTTVNYFVDGALFDSANPPSGSTITPFTDIIVTFVGKPKNLGHLDHRYELERSGNKATILGNFEAGPLELNLVWDNNSHTLKYFVSDRPIAEVKDVWVDHNVFEGGVKGMRIHVKLRVANPFRGLIAVYFHFRDGGPLKDFNDRFRTTDGNVYTGRDFNNPHALAGFDDFPIFMPYSELHMNKGFHRLEFHVRVFDKDRGRFVDDPRYKAVNFTFER